MDRTRLHGDARVGTKRQGRVLNPAGARPINPFAVYSIMKRWKKLVGLCRRPVFIAPLIRHGVAGGIEHYAVVKYLSPRTLIDVGANKGQFSLLARKLSPKTRIFAFEPLKEAADRYERLFGDDENATLHRLAVDMHRGESAFYVSDHSDSSSLLRIGPGQKKAFGNAFSRQITVKTTRLDDVVRPEDLTPPTLLKIDVQGAERNVILSAGHLLDHIDHIYVEASFIELYDGQSLFRDVFRELDAKGFRMRGAFNQVTTAAYHATQVDVLFSRNCNKDAEKSSATPTSSPSAK